MGVACPFAHCKEELNAPPDLSKTKLCVPWRQVWEQDTNDACAAGPRLVSSRGQFRELSLPRVAIDIGEACEQ